MTKFTHEIVRMAEASLTTHRVFMTMGAINAFQSLIAAAREQLGQQAAAPVVEQVERAYVDFRNSYAPIAGTSVLKHFDKLGAAIAALAVAPPPANKSFHSDAFKMASDKALADRKFVRDALEAVAPPPAQQIENEVRETCASMAEQYDESNLCCGKTARAIAFIIRQGIVALSTLPVRQFPSGIDQQYGEGFRAGMQCAAKKITSELARIDREHAEVLADETLSPPVRPEK